MKDCFYCSHKIDPSFEDVANLQKFLTARKKITTHERSLLCAKHQRKLAKAVKYARFLALLPYTAYQTDRAGLESVA